MAGGRLSIFAKRQAGELATPEQWKDRELPSPSARLALAAVAACEEWVVDVFYVSEHVHAAGKGLFR